MPAKRRPGAIEANLSALKAILINTFGKRAVAEDDLAVAALATNLPPKEAEKLTWREVAGAYNANEALTLWVTLDVRPSQFEPDALLRKLAELNNVGVDYGAFQIFEPQDFLRFRTGFSGALEEEIPTVILAETLAYAIEVAEAGRELLLPLLKKSGDGKKRR